MVQAEELKLKDGGDPETFRGFSPTPPTRAGPGIPWKAEEVKASPSPPLRSPPLKKLTPGPAHKLPITHRPAQALPHRSGMT